MASGNSKNVKVRHADQAETTPHRVTSSDPIEIFGPKGRRTRVLSFRFVNTHASTTFTPMIWVVPKGETLGTQHQYYPTGMSVEAGFAVHEAAPNDKPLFSTPYEATVYGAALAGEGNIWATELVDTN